MKHNVLMNKVLDGGVSKKVRRRRPGKKMEAVEGLGKSLAEALPDLDGDEDEWEGVSGDEADGGRGRKEGKMVMKSLKHRPGAMKRKRVMEERERERFGRNLAQLVGGGKEEGGGGGGVEKTGGGGGNAAGGPSQADRWAALRQFIGGSMEKDRAFAQG